MATITLQQPQGQAGIAARPIVGRVTGTRYPVNQLGQVTVDTQDAGDLRAQGWIPVTGAGSGKAHSGTGTVDFGAFPGSDFASVNITAADADDPDAVLFGFIVPTVTADHSADEHLVDPPQVVAVNNGDGTITIKAVPRPALPQPDSLSPPDPMPYGKWTVGYAFLQ